MKRTPLFEILLFVLLIFELPKIANTQNVNLGNPPVLNFPKKEYKAGTQVWDMAQDHNGIMWFGNNDGLLEFDGVHWRLHPLNNRTIVRSVCVETKGNKVFVGGQGEFGYFASDGKGVMEYHSLKSLLPAHQQHFGDVWDVLVREEGAFFRTDHQVFYFDNNRVDVLLPSGSTLNFMGEWRGKLIVQDGNSQIYVFENGQLKTLENPREFRFGKISGILQLSKDTTLVTTIKDGIWYFSGEQFRPWVTQNDAFLKNNIIFCAGQLANGDIALGTSLNGLVTLDKKRRIYHHINKKSGLQNNTVLSLFATRTGGLWLGLDNGIDFIDINSPFSSVFPDGELQGTGYTAKVFGNKIYFGTNTGLYAIDWKSYYPPGVHQQFSLVQHSQGQVWNLQEIGGNLLMSHHEGAFEIKGLDAQKIANLQGIWKFVQISPEYAVAGHYNGLALFKKSGTGWHFVSILKGLTESSRLLAKDPDGIVWMAHPYRGLYRLKIYPASGALHADFFNSNNGLPSDLGNHLFQLGDQVLFAGEHGIFDFDSTTRNFIPNHNFDHVFGSKSHLRHIEQDKSGNIWYVTNQEAGILVVENSTLEKKVHRIVIPELGDKMNTNFPFILPVDAYNMFIATDHGFLHFNPAAYFPRDSTLRLVLHEVRLKTGPDSLLFGGHRTELQKAQKTELTARQNSLFFAFSAIDYPGNEFVRYSHRLEGADNAWSAWSPDTDLSFNNLVPGSYVFQVKARNQYGIESAIQTFKFTILPPWYASNWAYLVYYLSAIGLVAGIIYRQQQRFAKEKSGLVDLHEQHARSSEEAINYLKNEKLEAEIKHKNQELASVTLHIVQKSEILNIIKDRLEKIKDQAKPLPGLEKELLQLIKMLEQDTRTDADWEQFSRRFDEVHSDFLKRMSEQYAHLSPSDYKLCAYLRLNLSSKEIASLMNISLRGVESSRYRLRKRLGLDTEENLTEFLMRF